MELLVYIIVGFSILHFLKKYFVGEKVTYTNPSGESVAENLKRREPRVLLEIEKPDIELTPEIETILSRLENTSDNIFLTGKAGTGKSTLLKYFRATTKKQYVVVAPTGVAAINVQGQTIHSFFGFGIDITLDSVKYTKADKLVLLRKLDTLIIDEISMVRADLLDCIDKSLKMNRRNKLPFGGIQIVAIGDPYQLPPVVSTSERKFFETVYKSAHFFNSFSYITASFTKLELTKIYRQKEETFKSALNNIRCGTATEDDIDLLNENTKNNIADEDSIKLVTTNALAKIINNRELNNLPGTGVVYAGHITGDFNEKVIPTDMELLLKEGAKIMLLNNDKLKRWVNGDVGIIIELNENSVRVKFEDNTFDDVDLNEWDNIKFIYDEEEGKIVPEVVGKYIQLPIKHAWAVTIHKSQGKTFTRVHIDFGTGTFAPGQAYVALSRCTSLEGLSFESPMLLQDILIDPEVQEFMGHDTSSTNNLTETAKESSIGPTLRGISTSDMNKLISFMNNPQKYATNTNKAKEKVANAIKSFESIKHSLDSESIQKYENALKTYTSMLSKKQ